MRAWPAIALLLPGICHGETYAVLAGVSQYGDKLRLSNTEQLKFPASDAYGVYRVLLSRSGGNLRPANALLLTDAQVTRAALEDAIEKWLPSRGIGPADAVVVYLSGHGYLMGDTGYFVPHDAEQGKIAATSYSTTRLFEKLAELKAGSVLLLTDACHSGALNERADDLNKALTQNNPHAIISLAASAAEEQAIETRGEDQHTLFGHYLIRGLEGGADADCDNQVSAKELVRYVQTLVQNDSQKKQVPSYRIPPGREQTTLWRGRSARCAPGWEFGKLLVKVTRPETLSQDEYAVVLLDGSVVGTIAPKVLALRIRGLRPGPHLVEVFQRDSLPAAREIVVQAGHEAEGSLNLAPIPAMPLKVQQQLAEARKLYEKGTPKVYKQALTLLASAENLSPDDAKIAYETGLVYQALEDRAQARVWFANALKRNPALLQARVLSADLAEQPGESIRELVAVHGMLENDYFPATALARAYQRAGLCAEGIRWARKGGDIHTGDAQAEPLLEAGISLVKCGAESNDPAWQQEHFRLAVQALKEALQRVDRFEGSKQLCAVGRHTFGLAWCKEAAKQEQAKFLRYRTRVYLTYAHLLVGDACAAEEVYREAQEDDAKERQRLEFLIYVAGASSSHPCARQRFTWAKACQLRKNLAANIQANRQVAEASKEVEKHLSLSTCQ